MKSDKIYTVNDIQEMLGVSRTTAYRFIQDTYRLQKPFKVRKIGNTYRIPKIPFDNWINGIDD